MHTWKNIWKPWTSHSITTKFSLAFAVLLLLLFLISAISIVTLTITRHATESTIFVNTHIQHLVLEMNWRLEKSRRLKRDFFLHYPRIGFSAAHQQYAQPAMEQATQVHRLHNELQALIEQPGFSGKWLEYEVDLRLYLSAVNRHALTIEEAVDLVSKLADEDSGIRTQLARHSAQLSDLFRTANDADLLATFRDMQMFEKEYLITRQRPFMQSAFNVAHGLRQAIEHSSGLDADKKTLVLDTLDAYRAVAEEMLDVNIAIRNMFQEFDMQARAISPIAEESVALAHAEIERIRSQVGQISRSATMLLLITAVAGVGLAGVIAGLLNRHITRNIVTLSHTAREFQAGRLHARAGIESDDELGQLAGSFNAMAVRIEELVSGLEQNVADRTAELSASNRQLQQVEQELRIHAEHLEDMVIERTTKLRDAQEQLVRREKLAVLGQMAGSVGHELRNPLAAISNAGYYLNLVLADADTEVREYLDLIAGEVRNAERIVSDLLGFSRVKPGTMAAAAVADLIDLVFAKHEPPPAIRIRSELAAGLPAVTIDPHQIEQVLTNIITNAYQAMPEGGTLTIEAGINDTMVVLAVRDTGCGISQENISKLFEPLFTTKPKGIGLGLALSKTLIEVNGGTIDVESEEGKGSVFLIRLPLTEEGKGSG